MKQAIRTGALAVLAFGAAAAAAAGSQKPDATLRLTGTAVVAGAGVMWGRGTLSYKGKEYPVDAS